MNLRVAALAASTAAVLAALALLAWVGGELHYRNCLANAEQRYPVAYQQAVPNPDNPYAEQLGLPGGGTNGEFVFHDPANRSDAIAGCSRWP